MDVQMPIMDGFAATQEIIKLYKAKNATSRSSEQLQVPLIVAMTANESKGEKDRCLAAGFELFLGKPPLPEDLVRVLVRVFGQEMLDKMREEQE